MEDKETAGNPSPPKTDSNVTPAMGQDIITPTIEPEMDETPKPAAPVSELVGNLKQPDNIETETEEEFGAIEDDPLDDDSPSPQESVAVAEASDSGDSGDSKKPKLRDKLFGSKKKKIIFAVVVVLVALLGVGAWLVFGSSDDSGDQSNQSQVTAVSITVEEIEGTAEYSETQGESWTEIQTDQELSEGDWLRTGEEDRAIVRFGDGSVTRLDYDTTIELISSQSDNIKTRVISGVVYSRVTSSDQRAFNVATDLITIKSIGTGFIVGSSADSDRAAVYEGSVLETITDTELKEGQGLTMQRTDSENTVGDLNIELEKADEFVIWNRNKDLKEADFKNKLGILADLEAPALSLTTPTNGQKIALEENTTSTSIEFTGETEVGAGVSITGSNNTAQEVTAGSDGKFTAVLVAEPGEIDYDVIATDENGNKTTVSVSVVVEEPASATNQPITLTAVSTSGEGLVLNWTFAADYVPSDGIQVLWSVDEGGLSYPVTPKAGTTFVATGPCGDGNYGSKLVTTSATSTICVQNGVEYSVRVCKYTTASNSCDVYSNELRLTAPSLGND